MKAQESKIIKGYVKTENMILLVVAALAVGFVAGVVFSVFRAGDTMPAGMEAGGKPQVSADQKQILKELSEKTKRTPDDVEAWTQLGHLYFDMDQPAEAIAAYETSLKLDGSRPDVWTDLGVMYRRNGDPRKAVETFDRALSLKPDHRIALFNKGIVLMHDLDDTQGALAAWERLLSIDPETKTPGGDSLKSIVEQLKRNASQAGKAGSESGK
ncbi:MAG: tetratricopeptide repeat protein [Desulfatitalea sp.]|nr:tetratricopeptide repeat protein [Desulfatitalea sp.]